MNRDLPLFPLVELIGRVLVNSRLVHTSFIHWAYTGHVPGTIRVCSENVLGMY